MMSKLALGKEDSSPSSTGSGTSSDERRGKEDSPVVSRLTRLTRRASDNAKKPSPVQTLRGLRGGGETSSMFDTSNMDEKQKRRSTGEDFGFDQLRPNLISEWDPATTKRKVADALGRKFDKGNVTGKMLLKLNNQEKMRLFEVGPAELDKINAMIERERNLQEHKEMEDAFGDALSKPPPTPMELMMAGGGGSAGGMSSTPSPASTPDRRMMTSSAPAFSPPVSPPISPSGRSISNSDSLANSRKNSMKSPQLSGHNSENYDDNDEDEGEEQMLQKIANNARLTKLYDETTRDSQESYASATMELSELTADDVDRMAEELVKEIFGGEDELNNELEVLGLKPKPTPGFSVTTSPTPAPVPVIGRRRGDTAVTVQLRQPNGKANGKNYPSSGPPPERQQHIDL